MGGFGSSRWEGVRTRRTVGACYQLRPRDIAEALRRVEGSTDPHAGCHLRLTWHDREGGELASIGASVVRDAGAVEVVLRYGVRIDGGPQERIAERISCEPLDQRGAAGGRRWWFCCPWCGRRCGVLYLPPDAARWRCRTCYGLTYPSCNASDKRISRAVRAIARGEGVGDVGAMSVTALGVSLMAFKVYQERVRRALIRDLGRRAYRRYYGWLEARM